MARKAEQIVSERIFRGGWRTTIWSSNSRLACDIGKFKNSTASSQKTLEGDFLETGFFDTAGTIKRFFIDGS